MANLFGEKIKRGCTLIVETVLGILDPIGTTVCDGQKPA